MGNALLARNLVSKGFLIVRSFTLRNPQRDVQLPFKKGCQNQKAW